MTVSFDLISKVIFSFSLVFWTSHRYSIESEILHRTPLLRAWGFEYDLTISNNPRNSWQILFNGILKHSLSLNVLLLSQFPKTISWKKAQNKRPDLLKIWKRHLSSPILNAHSDQGSGHLAQNVFECDDKQGSGTWHKMCLSSSLTANC